MTGLCVNISMALFFSACILHSVYAIFSIRSAGKCAAALLSLGFFSTTLALVTRWHHTGHPPFANLYESMVMFAWAISLAYLIAAIFFKAQFMGASAALMALSALGYASICDSTAHPLLPALKSNWIVIHVSSYLVGYGAAAVACVSSVIYLLTSRRSSSDERGGERFDALSYRLIALAFPFLTIGLTTGSVWANVAWGRYWNWDPKETWSLITWLIYALYFHLRLMRGWRGRRAAFLAVAGFVAILVTFIGVSRMWGGLHSYG